MKTVEDLMRIMISTCRLFVVLALLAGATQAQTSGTTAAKSPSPELVGALTKQLGITPTQATGGAGTLFKLAKSRLNAADFSKVSAAVPGMSGFLKAAPSVNSSTGGIPGVSGLSGALPGAAGGLANAAQSFQKLGLSSGMIGKFVPVLTRFVQGKGGANVASLLSGALR